MHSAPLFSFTLFGKEFAPTLYGIFLSIGLLACLAVYKIYTDYRKIDIDVQDFGFITAILSIAIGFLCAACYQSVYNYIETGEWSFGAITVMGGLIGGAAAFLLIYFVGGKYYFKGKKKGIHVKEFNKILLVAPVCIAIAHSFGRIGCLMAGCCHGKEVAGPSSGGILMNGTYYIPTQLYEAIFLLILFVALSVMYFKRMNFTHVVYLISYGIWRFVIEYFRDDSRGSFIPGMTPSQFQSIIFVLAGIAILIYMKRTKKLFMLSPNDDKNDN